MRDATEDTLVQREQENDDPQIATREETRAFEEEIAVEMRKVMSKVEDNDHGHRRSQVGVVWRDVNASTLNAHIGLWCWNWCSI